MTEIKIGENIRFLRKKRKIGQDVLAEHLGVSVQAVSKWETGGSMPDITLLPQIAAFFDISIEELFYGIRDEEEPEPTTAEPEEAVSEQAVPPAEENEPLDEEAEVPHQKQEPPEEEYWMELEDMFHKMHEEEMLYKTHGAEKTEPTRAEPEKEAASEQTVPPAEETESPNTDSRPYGWKELKNLRRTISNTFAGSFKKFHRTADNEWARENAVRSDLPDDQVMRIVQFVGNRIVAADEVTDEKPIHLAIDPTKTKIDLYVYGSASIQGGISGDVQAESFVRCGNVGKGVTAEEWVQCQSVSGSVNAEGDVTCNNVGGKVSAEGDVTCGNVTGNVTAEGNIHCGQVIGSVRCEGNIYHE